MNLFKRIEERKNDETRRKENLLQVSKLEQNPNKKFTVVFFYHWRLKKIKRVSLEMQLNGGDGFDAWRNGVIGKTFFIRKSGQRKLFCYQIQNLEVWSYF